MAKTQPTDYYSAESDLHHLTQAHQIKQDPKRHKAAKAIAKQKMSSYASIANPQPPTKGTK